LYSQNQVLLAAVQNPLLGEHHFAKGLLPRLCGVILAAPKAARHLLVKWWSDYPGQLLESRVVSPLQVGGAHLLGRHWVGLVSLPGFWPAWGLLHASVFHPAANASWGADH
jgi:hypothetical protein